MNMYVFAFAVGMAALLVLYVTYVTIWAYWNDRVEPVVYPGSTPKSNPEDDMANLAMMGIARQVEQEVWGDKTSCTDGKPHSDTVSCPSAALVGIPSYMTIYRQPKDADEQKTAKKTKKKSVKKKKTKKKTKGKNK